MVVHCMDICVALLFDVIPLSLPYHGLSWDADVMVLEFFDPGRQRRDVGANQEGHPATDHQWTEG